MSVVRHAGSAGFDQKDVRRSAPPFATTASTLSERRAVCAGIRAGDAARARFDQTGVLLLFGERATTKSASPRLMALRTYAELRRALLPRGLDVPATSLVAVGFTVAQIARFDVMIDHVSTFAPPDPQTCAYPRQREMDR